MKFVIEDGKIIPAQPKVEKFHDGDIIELNSNNGSGKESIKILEILGIYAKVKLNVFKDKDGYYMFDKQDCKDVSLFFAKLSESW